MSDEQRGERQDANNRHLVPYGVGGDYVGARRTRRAFRLLVFACVGFTFSLYLVERYMRYELNEVHYRMALTLEDDSQRAILRNVVRRDAEQSELPNARYVEALAYIEEDDLVLERYAEAAKLAPEKGSLLIVYGCKLFQQRKFAEARQIFREATLKTTKDALPKYLQAAALAASSETEDDFRTALALVARTNDSGEQPVFPQPLWHESLPKGGNWYENLQRRLTDQVCAPLYHLRNVVAKRARAATAEGDVAEWDMWLTQLQQMGERLVGGRTSAPENLGTRQALCGLQIQKDALAVRIERIEARGEQPEAALTARLATVQKAIATIQKFEVDRESLASVAEELARRPLRLALNGFLILFAFSAAGWLLSKVFRTDKSARALRQGRGRVSVLLAWTAFMALVLLQMNADGSAGFHAAVAALWYLLLAGIVVFSVASPLVVLPSPATVCQPFLAEPNYADKLHEAQRRRRRAFLSLSGRYLNVALGAYVMLLSAHFIAYRVLYGLYPTDLKLLVAGVELREMAMFNELFQLLSS